MWDTIVSSIIGDKNRGWQNTLRCTYFLCPSNEYRMRELLPNYDGTMKPARMKFVQKIQPSVYMYKCKDCGCLSNVSVEIDKNGRESWRINPSLISGRPSFTTNWRW